MAKIRLLASMIGCFMRATVTVRDIWGCEDIEDIQEADKGWPGMVVP